MQRLAKRGQIRQFEFHRRSAGGLLNDQQMLAQGGPVCLTRSQARFGSDALRQAAPELLIKFS